MLPTFSKRCVISECIHPRGALDAYMISIPIPIPNLNAVSKPDVWICNSSNTVPNQTSRIANVWPAQAHNACRISSPRVPDSSLYLLLNNLRSFTQRHNTQFRPLPDTLTPLPARQESARDTLVLLLTARSRRLRVFLGPELGKETHPLLRRRRVRIGIPILVVQADIFKRCFFRQPTFGECGPGVSCWETGAWEPG